MPTTTFTTLATRLPVRTQCGNDQTIWDWNLDSMATPTCPTCGFTDPTYSPSKPFAAGFRVLPANETVGSNKSAIIMGGLSINTGITLFIGDNAVVALL